MTDEIHKPEPGQNRRRRRPRSAAELDARREIAALAEKHRALCVDHPSLRRKLVRHYQAQLRGPRKPAGAKPSVAVLEAVELLKALGRKPTSKDWGNIYRRVLPDLKKLDYAARRHKTDNLRHAALNYLRRERERMRAKHSVR